MHFFYIFLSKNLHMSKFFCTFAPDLKTNIITIIVNNNNNNLKFTIMKTIGTIKLIEVTDKRITVFDSAIEKQQYIQTHKDAYIDNYHAIEPLYILIDSEGTGFCLNPDKAVTYNEAISIIQHYI